MPSADSNLHIDEVSRTMADWLSTVAQDVAIHHVAHFPSPEDESGTKTRIEICFHSIVEEKPDRAQLNRSEPFWVAYLLRVRGSDALKCQRVFSEVYFAAHGSDDFKIGAPESARPFDAESHLQPGNPAVLMLSTRLIRSIELPESRIVVHPLNLKVRTMGRVSGQVVSEDGTPIMRAAVEARALNKRVVADRNGRFSIPGAPATGVITLSVNARGRAVEVAVNIEKQAEVVIVLPEEKQHA